MGNYDLESRTRAFAISVRLSIRQLPKNIAHYEDGKQVIRSSGSVGANYIEANEKLGPKDFKFRLRVARKEAKESEYWLKILKATNETRFSQMLDQLISESSELRKILSAIINKH